MSIERTVGGTLSELYRAHYFEKIRMTVILILVGSVLAYLGLLAWFEVSRILGGLVGVPGVLLLIFAVPNGFEKSSAESVVHAIDAALLSGEPKVHLQNVGRTIGSLASVPETRRKAVMQETTLIWNPVYDSVVELFIETIEGEPPRLQVGQDRKPLRAEDGGYFIEGGWPCQFYGDGWPARATVLLDDYRTLRAEHQLSGKPDRDKEYFTRLLGYLEKCASDPRSLSGADVGMIRLIMASFAVRRGWPGSSRHTSLRRRQVSEMPLLSRDWGVARVVMGRLEAMPHDGGLDSPDEFLKPVTPAEAFRYAPEPPLAKRLDDRPHASGCPRCGSLAKLSAPGGVECYKCGAFTPSELLNLGPGSGSEVDTLPDGVDCPKCGSPLQIETADGLRCFQCGAVVQVGSIAPLPSARADHPTRRMGCPRCGSLAIVTAIEGLRCSGCGNEFEGQRVSWRQRSRYSKPPRNYTLKSGQEIPDQIKTEVRRCLQEPLRDMIQKGAISSGPDIAAVIPQLDRAVNPYGLPVDTDEVFDAVQKRLSEDSPLPLAVPSRLLTMTMNAVMLIAIAGAISLGVVLIIVLGDFSSSATADSHGISTTEIERAVAEFAVRQECSVEDSTVELDLTEEDYARVGFLRNGDVVEFRYYYESRSVLPDKPGEYCF